MAADAPEAPVTGGKRAAAALFLFTIWQSFLTSGIVYGWTPLLIVLKKEGVYRHRCPLETEDCNERDVALNLMFTIGSISMIFGGVLAGPFPFPKIGLAFGGLLVSIGSLTMALADASSDFAYPFAYVCMGAGGGIIHFGSFSIGNIFGPYRGYIMSGLAGIMGFSSLVFQIVYPIYMAGASREGIFLVHACLVLLNACGSLWLWPIHPFRSGDSVSFKNGRMVVPPIGPINPSAPAQPRAKASWRAIYEAGLSKPFLSLCFFLTCQMWFSRCLMGMFSEELEWKNEQLEEQGSKLDVDMHLTFFNMSQAMLGSTMIPIFGMLVARFGHRGCPIFATGVLALVWNICLMIPAEWPLYVLYFFAAWHRQFFQSTFMTFITTEYAPEIYGALLPFINIVSGGIVALQNPVLAYTLHGLEGNFYPLLTFTLVLGGLLTMTAGMVFLHETRRKAALEEKIDEQNNAANEEKDEEESVTEAI